MDRAKPRPQILKCLLTLSLLAALTAGAPAAAERLRIIPVPPHVTPEWTPVPDLPQMYYAPNLPTDVFRHRGRYYFFWAGVWYRSKKVKGPWMRVDPPPAILSQINPSYFKTLPKEGAPAPEGAAPGQPPPGEGLLTPEGKPVVPPKPPTAPAPPAAASPPPQSPETAQPQEPAAPAQPPESQESAPLAVPEGKMPKVM